jgi:hypothetical protein
MTDLRVTLKYGPQHQHRSAGYTCSARVSLGFRRRHAANTARARVHERVAVVCRRTCDCRCSLRSREGGRGPMNRHATGRPTLRRRPHHAGTFANVCTALVGTVGRPLVVRCPIRPSLEKLRRLSVAGATSREGHRSQRSGRASQHRRWDQGRLRRSRLMQKNWLLMSIVSKENLRKSECLVGEQVGLEKSCYRPPRLGKLAGEE